MGLFCSHLPSKVTPGYDNVPEEKEANGHVTKDKNILRGDVTQKYEARRLREEKLLQRQRRITSAAEEFSERVMEEKERLSLGSKSRGTSRNTSRTASPSLPRRHVTFNTVPSVTPRTDLSRVSDNDGEVTEDTKKVNGPA